MKASKSKGTLVERVLAALPEHLRLAAALLSESELKEAVGIFAEKSKMTAAKFAMLLLVNANPHLIPNDGDEAEMRGIRRETLKEYKEEGWLPQVFGGVVNVQEP